MNKPITQVLTTAAILAFLVAGKFEAFTPWGMTPSAQVALTILLVAATLWVTEAVPLFVTSFIILLLCLGWLLPIMTEAGIEITKASFSGPFFSDIIMLFLGGFVLSSALHRYRLDELMARWVIARTGSSIPKLLLGVMCITAFLSMWLSNTATAAMMTGLTLPIVNRLPGDDGYRKALLLAIPLAANVGGLGTPIGSPPNAIALQYLRDLGHAPTFLTWMAMGIPFVIVLLLFMWGLLQLLFRGKTKSLTPDTSPMNLRKSAGMAVVIVVTLVTVLGWLTTGWHPLSTGAVALLPVVVLFGLRILTIKDLRALSWDVLILMGGGLCLGVAISQSGLAAWMVERVPTDELGATGLLVVLGVGACVMSTLMSNTATANLVLPVVAGFSMDNPTVFFVVVAFACSLAMALPISTPPNAIAFSAGEIKVKDMLRAGLAVSVVGLGLTLAFGPWWWHLVGLK